MKARVKSTGALLEVRFRDTDTEHPYICDMQGECGTLWKESELEFLDADPDYWTRLEHQYAGMAMQGLIASKRGLNIETDMYDIPYYSQMLAHALVEKMKEKEERK
jgi:hypothetical protein